MTVSLSGRWLAKNEKEFQELLVKLAHRDGEFAIDEDEYADRLPAKIAPLGISIRITARLLLRVRQPFPYRIMEGLPVIREDLVNRLTRSIGKVRNRVPASEGERR
jgi:hypothetical protein